MEEPKGRPADAHTNQANQELSEIDGAALVKIQELKEVLSNRLRRCGGRDFDYLFGSTEVYIKGERRQLRDSIAPRKLTPGPCVDLLSIVDSE